MKFNDGFFFLYAEIATFYIRSEVINPSKTTTLSTPHQSFITCIDWCIDAKNQNQKMMKSLRKDQGFKIRNITSLLGERSPILMTILVNERDEFQVFVVAPWSSFHFCFVTTWRSSFAHSLYTLPTHTFEIPFTKSSWSYVYLYKKLMCDPDF